MSGLHRSEDEFLRLRHELELTRKELSAAVELHERAGTMIAEALGRHALTHQVGWLYEDYAADIRHLVEQGDRLAVTKEWANAKAQECGEIRAALVRALDDVKRGNDNTEKLLALIATLEADIALATDALATVKEDLQYAIRGGGSVDLARTHTDADVALQALFNSRASRTRSPA